MTKAVQTDNVSLVGPTALGTRTALVVNAALTLFVISVVEPVIKVSIAILWECVNKTLQIVRLTVPVVIVDRIRYAKSVVAHVIKMNFVIC